MVNQVENQTQTRRWTLFGVVGGKIIGCCGGLAVAGGVAGGTSLSTGASVAIVIGSIAGGAVVGGLSCFAVCKIIQHCYSNTDAQQSSNHTDCCENPSTQTSSHTKVLRQMPGHQQQTDHSEDETFDTELDTLETDPRQRIDIIQHTPPVVARNEDHSERRLQFH